MDKTISQLKKEASEHEAQAKAIRRRMKEFWSDVDANIDEVILYINKSDKNNANMSDTFEQQVCKAYGVETSDEKAALLAHLTSERQINYYRSNIRVVGQSPATQST